MSDVIKHECGIAVVRLLKPLSYYLDKYGTAFYGLNKLYLLMEKQHNRGQDGAGLVNIKLDMPPGTKVINRQRSVAKQPILDIFETIFQSLEATQKDYPNAMRDVDWLKRHNDDIGELFMGHLRYGTHGGNTKEACHPLLRQNNWIARNLALAGNFNMTNADDLFQQLVDLGQHPKELSDTVTVLEKIGHFLDVENQRLFDKYKQIESDNRTISQMIAQNLSIQRILSRSARDFDGGYVMSGLIGHGDAFVLRDPNGIRPAFYYCDDEVAVAASERPAIQTAFDVYHSKIKEITPGRALVIKKNGTIHEEECLEQRQKTSCTFERIYFSRGTDKDIYEERKQLGYLLCDDILQAIDYDLDNTVFSFIPNTAEVAFYGLIKGLEEYQRNQYKEQILQADGPIDEPVLDQVLNHKVRVEKLAVKDVKLRTFITEDASRNDLVSHIYDVTYGIIQQGIDTLVVLDDSIVRGTTLKQSILHNLDRLGPRRIIIVSSAPQIRYPDCYGIDMSKMKNFVAFRAAVALLKERGQEHLLDDIYSACKEQEHLPAEEVENEVKRLYEPFTDAEISQKIADIVKPQHMFANVDVIYQSIENLHNACPAHKGDWYFSGNFPTDGGHKVVNKSFIYFMEGKDKRAY